VKFIRGNSLGHDTSTGVMVGTKTRRKGCAGIVWRTGTIMTECNTRVSFEARRLARAPGWYVRVAWPNGRCDHIPGFVTQHEAQRWINQKGDTWVNEANTPEFAFRPRARTEGQGAQSIPVAPLATQWNRPSAGPGER
jgi:hypothetical protein